MAYIEDCIGEHDSKRVKMQTKEEGCFQLAISMVNCLLYPIESSEEPNETPLRTLL